MRGFLITTTAALGLALGSVALADPGATTDEPAEAVEDSTAEANEAPETDCSTLEGEAKTACETAAATEKPVEEKAAEEPKGKGGKAKRSNTNRMERVHEDE